MSQIAPTTFFWPSLEGDIIIRVTSHSHPTGFGLDGAQTLPFPPALVNRVGSSTLFFWSEYKTASTSLSGLPFART